MSVTARWLIGSIIAGLVVIGGLVIWLWPVLIMLGNPHRTGSYRFGSDSMAPTLAVGDVIRPLRLAGRKPSHGTIIVFRGPDTIRVARVVGLAGDVVSMRAGRLMINGDPVRLRRGRDGPRLSDGTATRLFLEQLPGENGWHALLDAGPSPADDIEPVRIPKDHLYVLGDNRDRAADSRFSSDQMGVGFVSDEDVIGIVDRVLWSASFGSRGRAADQPSS